MDYTTCESLLFVALVDQKFCYKKKYLFLVWQIQCVFVSEVRFIECCGSQNFLIRIRSVRKFVDPYPDPIRCQKLCPISGLELGSVNIRFIR